MKKATLVFYACAIPLSIIAITAMAFFIDFHWWKSFSAEDVTYISTEKLVTWVAHVPNNFDDMELVTIDFVNDIAYYRYSGAKVTPEVGDTVYLYDDTPVTVSSVTDMFFTVNSEEPATFYVGLSNTPVKWEDGTVIGYVSTLLPNGHCQCIWR